MKTLFRLTMTALIVGSAIILGIVIATVGLIVDEAYGPDGAHD